MAIPTKTIVTQTYEGETITCAKFSCTETSDFKFSKVAPIGGNYQFQVVIRASATRTISVQIGGETKTITISSTFKRYTLSWMGVSVNSSTDLIMSFPSGDYWLYNIQLERATSPSGWRPAPEDAADDATVIAGSIAEDKAAAAVEAQTQADIFNKLTNNGQVQGLYMTGGKIYLNATYIQTGTLSIKKNNVETFYANADTGVIRIKADEFSLSSGETLASTLASAESYADSASSSAASNAVNAQTQEFVFNKLTNNQQDQGIYLSGGKLYINATYIATGTLSANRIAAKAITAAKLADAVNNSISSAQTAANTAQTTANGANSQTQIVYISKASGTTSVSAPTAWVTNTTGNQNTWTIKRPQYNSSYPVCFVATQSKTVGGTVSCTTPQIDLTTTVIDGGHITTGTIDASVVSVTNLNASNITSGTISANKISGGILQDSGGNTVLNLSTGALAAKKLSITSTNFTLTEAGVITAKSGTIGGWTIGVSSLYNGMTSLADTSHNGVWIGTDGIAVGKGNFKVTNTGVLTAKSGTVGGFTIDTSSIRSGDLASTANNAIGISTANFSRVINGSTRNALVLAVGGKFGVSNAGILYAADAVLSGNISATAGTIGGWGIESYGMYRTNGSSWTSYIGETGHITRNIAGSGQRSDWIAVFGSKVGVNNNGALYCSEGYMNNVTLQSGCNANAIAGNIINAAEAQIESIIADTVTANYITSKSAVLGKMSATSTGISVDGTIYASGNITGNSVYTSNYQTAGATGQSATYTLKDANGNTVLGLAFTNGLFTGIAYASDTYTFSCTKTFYYSKTQKTIYAYASATSQSRIQYYFDYVSSISAGSGGTAVTI